MTIRSANARQIGYALETVAGAAATPTSFVPLSDESFEVKDGRVESDAVIAGARVARSSQWNGGNYKVGGDVQHELTTSGLGMLFKAAFGAVNTSGAGTFTHVFTPGDLPTLTAQVGRPATDGTIYPATYAGAKVASWEIGVQTGAIATIGLTFAAMYGEAGSRQVSDGATATSNATITSASAAFTAADESKTVSGVGIPAGARILSVDSATQATLDQAATATGASVDITIGVPLAAASYAAGTHLLKCNHLGVSIGGEPLKVIDAKIAGDNAVKDDRYFGGSRWPDEPVEDTGALRAYTGTITCEFASLALYDRFVAGDEADVSVELAAHAASVTLAGNARFDENTPSGSSRDLLTQSLPVVFIGSSTDASAMTATLVNTDATP